MNYQLSELPEELVNNFKENRSIFFVGAGLSIGSGMPSWLALLNDLIGLAKKKKWVKEEKVKEYRKLLKKDKYLLVAEDLKVVLGKDYFTHMKDTFGKPDVKPSKTHQVLLKFETQLILTTNYDRLLENAFTKINGYAPRSFKYNQRKEISNSYWKQDFFILKAHGDAYDDVDGIILTQKDYRKTLYKEVGYKSIVQSIFSTKSILFLGVSLADPEVNLILDYLHDAYDAGGPTHFLLIDEASVSETEERRFEEDYNIKTICYKNKDGKHTDVLEFLKTLRKAIK